MFTILTERSENFFFYKSEAKTLREAQDEALASFSFMAKDIYVIDHKNSLSYINRYPYSEWIKLNNVMKAL